MSNLSPQIEAAKVVSPVTRSDQNITLAAKGGSILLSGKLFAYAARFITGILLARFLAAEQYGLYNLSLTVVEIAAGVAALGLVPALVRYVPIYVSRRDENRLWGIIQLGLGLPAVISIFLGVGLYIWANPIAEQLFDEPKLGPLLQLVSPVILFFTLVDMMAAATRGFKNMHYTVIAQDIVLSVVKFALLLGLAIFGLNAAGAVTVTSLAQVIGCGLLVFFLNKQFSLKRPLLLAHHEIKEVLRFSLPSYMSQLMSIFSGNIKTIMLGTLHSVATVGIFAVARQITLISDMFHASIVTVSQPIIAELSSRGEREQMGRLYRTLTRWSFTLNFPLFLIIMLFPGAIISIFGQTFAEGVVVLKILAWAGLVNTGTGICGVLIDMSGNTHLKLVNTVTAIIANIGLSLFMIPQWGLVGAAVATLTGAILMNLLRLLEVFVLFRLQPYDLKSLKPVAAGLIALTAVWSIHQFILIETSLIQVSLKVLILLGLYGGMILLLGLSQEDHLVITRLRKRINTVLPNTLR